MMSGADQNGDGGDDDSGDQKGTLEVITLSAESLMMETNERHSSSSYRGVMMMMMEGMDGSKDPWIPNNNNNNNNNSSSSSSNKRRIYVCPDKNCVHHEESRALGDLTGIRKHFCRKHGVRRWKCGRCPKAYALHSDWKAHSKICGNREFICDSCGLSFAR